MTTRINDCQENGARAGREGLLKAATELGALSLLLPDLLLFRKGRLPSCDPHRAVSTDYNVTVSPWSPRPD